MPQRLAATLAILLALLSIPARVRAAQFQSPKGYAFSYPDDWRIASSADQQAVSDAVQKLLKTVDFTKIDVMIFDPQSNPIRSINVIAVPGPLPTDSSALSQMESGIRQQFSNAGISVTSFDCKFAHFGNYDGITATWDAVYGAVTMHQQEFIVGTGNQSFVITCSAGSGDFPAAQPVFNQMINGFQFTGGPAQALLDWWDGLSSVWRGAIIGAGIGLVIGIIRWLGGISKKAAPAPRRRTY